MSTILIIEDDKKINSLLSRILNKSGFETVCSDNGHDGLSLALNNDYSLILLYMKKQILQGFFANKYLQATLSLKKKI